MSRGFTIIELILFLAITSALIVGVLASAQVAIGEQQYKDTITGVQNELQRQYNDASYAVSFVRSSDDTGASCGAVRGASNCVIVGKLVRIQPKTLISSTVVAKPKLEGTTTNGIPLELEDSDITNDPGTAVELFGLYDFYVSSNSTENYSVPWSAEINEASLPSDQELRMLVIRSPETGVLYTYSALAAIASSVDYDALIDDSNRGEQCLSIPRGGLGTSSDLGVIIRADATSAGAIELMTDGDSC